MCPRRAPVLRHDVDLIFARGIGDVGDPFTVGRPFGAPVVDSGCTGEVAGVAVLRRHRENISACAKEGAIPVGRDLIVCHLVVDILESAASDDEVFIQAD